MHPRFHPAGMSMPLVGAVTRAKRLPSRGGTPQRPRYALSACGAYSLAVPFRGTCSLSPDRCIDFSTFACRCQRVLCEFRDQGTGMATSSVFRRNRKRFRRNPPSPEGEGSLPRGDTGFSPVSAPAGIFNSKLQTHNSKLPQKSLPLAGKIFCVQRLPTRRVYSIIILWFYAIHRGKWRVAP